MAEAIAREYQIGEEQGKRLIPLLSARLLAIGLRPLNYAPVKFSDMNKVITIKLTSGVQCPNPKDPYGSFDAPAMGKTMLAPLDDRPPLRLLFVFDESQVRLGARDIKLDEDMLWRIHRVGSKESRVSVIEVKASDNIRPMEGREETIYSHPLLDGVKFENIIAALLDRGEFHRSL